MNKLTLTCLLLLLCTGVARAQDSDGDGVPDLTDICPLEDASGFDVDGDGCLDITANTRHVEFWADADLPFTYFVHAAGAPIITDESDFAAIQAGLRRRGVLCLIRDDQLFRL